MKLLDLVALVLATWWLTYQIVFGIGLEWLRCRVGVGYDLDDKGNIIDRWEENTVATVINCYACTATFAGGLVYLMWWAGANPLIYFLAILGAVQLMGRWHTSQRPRTEWWL